MARREWSVPWMTPLIARAIEQLMGKGAGLIALHQSFTVSSEESKIAFSNWLGAVRVGMADRTTESAPVEVTEPCPPHRSRV